MRRNNFRKALNHIESRSVDENIARLNDELKKTGMLSEKMTTSTVLPSTITQTYIPPTDEPAPLGDFSDLDNFAWDTDAQGDGSSISHDVSQLQTTDVNGETKSILEMPSITTTDGSGFSGTPLGYAFGVNVAVSGTPLGYITSSGFVFVYQINNVFSVTHTEFSRQFVDYYEANTFVQKPIYLWTPLKYRGGQLITPVQTSSDGNKGLYGHSLLIPVDSDNNVKRNTIRTDLGRPRTTVLNRFEDPSSPDYFPGNVNRFLAGLLNVGKQAFDYLVGASDDFLSGDPNLSDVALQQASERQKAISNDPEVAKAAEQLGTAGKVFYDYLTNKLPDVIDNDYLGSEYVKSVFNDAQVNQLGTVTVGDNVVGTGGKATYNSETNEVSIPFNYDFQTNDQEFSDPSKAGYVSGPLGQFRKAVLNALGPYTADAQIATPIAPLNSLAGIVFGSAIGVSKALGGAQQKKGNVTINADELKKLNPVFHTQVVSQPLNQSYEPQGEVLSEGWQSPDHTNVEKDPKTRWFSPNAGTDAAKWFDPKEVKPIYPEESPEMIDGYNVKSNLAPKPVDKPPAIKLTKKDLLRNHRLKDSEVKEMMQTIDRINKFIAAHPEELIYAQSRYPKHDPRLAELNWKMDQMLKASNEYLDKQFPENERLFNRLKSATKRTIELTDPETYKKDPGKLTSMGNLAKVDSVMNHYVPKDRIVSKIKVEKKKSVNRFFVKPKRPDRPAYLRKKKKGKPNS